MIRRILRRLHTLYTLMTVAEVYWWFSEASTPCTPWWHGWGLLVILRCLHTLYTLMTWLRFTGDSQTPPHPVHPDDMAEVYWWFSDASTPCTLWWHGWGLLVIRSILRCLHTLYTLMTWLRFTGDSQTSGGSFLTTHFLHQTRSKDSIDRLGGRQNERRANCVRKVLKELICR